jgi:pilus assembly protein CpaE
MSESAADDGGNRRILVVGGSEAHLRTLRFYFTKAGYEVETDPTGQGALRATAAGVPDAVLCDEVLPDMDGLQLVRQLRASPVTFKVPVMVLSANASDAKIQAAIAAGANESIRRDAKPQDIGEAVARMLSAVTPSDEPAGEPSRAHTVTVLSARGGSGKTFMATSVGVALAQRKGETTCLLDLNLEFGTTAMMLDLRPTYTLRDVAEAAISDASDAEFDSMLLRHSSGLRVVPAVAQPGDSELIPDGSLPKIIERLRRLYDHLVVDGRPSFREVMLDLWEHSDSLLITCPPEVISVLVTRSLLEAFGVINVDPDKIIVVVNQVAPKARLTSAQVERGLNQQTFTIPYGGEQLYRAVDVGKAYLLERPNDSSAQAIRKLAEELVKRRASNVRTAARAG